MQAGKQLYTSFLPVLLTQLIPNATATHAIAYGKAFIFMMHNMFLRLHNDVF